MLPCAAEKPTGSVWPDLLGESPLGGPHVLMGTPGTHCAVRLRENTGEDGRVGC